jgi:membrane-associated phospholipid phosphatase
MPTLLFTLLFFLAPTPIGVDYFDFKFKFLLLGFIFIYTFVAPSGVIYWLYRANIIKSLKMENLQDRRIPYLFTASIYAGLACFFYFKNPLLFPLAYILGSITLVILCVAIVSFWWQISAHSAGVGGNIGALAAIIIRFNEQLLFYPFLLLLILAGLLIAARLYLNAHTSAQVFIGFLLGIFVSVGSVFLLF